MRLTLDEFTDLVREAFDELPTDVIQALDNLDIVVESWPSQDELRETGTRAGHHLLGLYSGVPMTERGGFPPLLPDKITLFKRPIELKCNTHAEVILELRVTLMHEVGHYLGMSEADLHRLGYG